MDGGLSYADVERAVPVSANVVCDPPTPLDLELARKQIEALDGLPRPPLVTAGPDHARPRSSTSTPACRRVRRWTTCSSAPRPTVRRSSSPTSCGRGPTGSTSCPDRTSVKVTAEAARRYRRRAALLAPARSIEGGPTRCWR